MPGLAVLGSRQAPLSSSLRGDEPAPAPGNIVTSGNKAETEVIRQRKQAETEAIIHVKSGLRNQLRT
ncbi:MAG TPA: hypothetical protein VIJ82_32960 [Streptosporangiaceae bacterium]